MLELRLPWVFFIEFVQRVAIHRGDFAIRVWRSWVLEDPLVHPHMWLRPDLVLLAPFLNCSPENTIDGFGVLVEPHAIDEQFSKAWMPFFCRGDKEIADLDTCRAVAEGLTPLMVEVQTPPLSRDMLYDDVQKKKQSGRLGLEGVQSFAGCLV